MMRIVYFSRKDLLWEELDSTSSKFSFIVPNPSRADGLRRQLSGFKGAADVITIAKFTSDLLRDLWSDEERPRVKRKAELLLIFGMLRNQYLPELGYEQFMQAYNLFSDLRSFTLNTDALQSVLETYPEVIRKTVLVFWQLLDVTGFADEHAAYHLLAERLRSGEEDERLRRTYVFWGFQHLNGQQVDLLKALSIRYPVVVPFPSALKPRLRRSDWVSWLADHRAQEVQQPESPVLPRARWYPVNSRELTLFLRQQQTLPQELVLGVARLSVHHLDLLPSGDVGFKVSHQLLSAEVQELHDDLSFTAEAGLQGRELSAWLEERRRLILRGKRLPFKQLKALQLYQEAFAMITAETDADFRIDAFYLKLLREVALMNQPRTSFAPLFQGEAKLELRDMSMLEDIPSGSQVTLCLDERFEDIQGLGPQYTEKIQKELASIGPLKRAELDLSFRQWELEDLFHRCHVDLLMPPAVLKHRLIWKKLLQNVHLEPAPLPAYPSARLPRDHFQELPRSPFTGSFSASKLQTYQDCPRKFYYSYVEKLSPSVTLEKDIDAMVSGILSHRIIQLAVEQQVAPEELAPLVSSVLDDHVRAHRLSLPREVRRERELVLLQRSGNGLRFLRRLEDAFGQRVQWQMEHGFDLPGDFALKGQIDCVGVTDEHVFLLDFKSTAGSAANFSEVLEFRELQLWVYAIASAATVPEFAQKKIVFGYVVLNEPDASSVLSTDTALLAAFTEAKLCKTKALDEFTARLDEARRIVGLTVKNIQEDQIFPSRPRTPDACTYCALVRVCVKGGDHGPG